MTLPRAAGLWGLVNNAGTCYLAEIELTPETVFRKVLEVNLMGAIRMTKTFLPLIRQSKGRIVNTSSLSGKWRSSQVMHRYFSSSIWNYLTGVVCQKQQQKH